MQGEAERALRCRPPSLPNRPHFDADSIDSAIPRPWFLPCNRRCREPMLRAGAGHAADVLSSGLSGRRTLPKRNDAGRQSGVALNVSDLSAWRRRELGGCAAQAKALREAQEIRANVSAVRDRQATLDDPLSEAGFQDWADRALSQADRIDPVLSGSFRMVQLDE